MWRLNALQIDSTLSQCLTPSMSSNCTLCEGVAFIGFSQHLILISMSDQSPLLSHFFLIGIREARGMMLLRWLFRRFHTSFTGGAWFCFPVPMKLTVGSHLRQNTVLAFKKTGRNPFRLTFRGANSILDAWWWFNWFHSSLWAVMTFLSCHKRCRRLACELRHEETITIVETEVEDLKSLNCLLFIKKWKRAHQDTTSFRVSQYQEINVKHDQRS